MVYTNALFSEKKNDYIYSLYHWDVSSTVSTPNLPGDDVGSGPTVDSIFGTTPGVINTRESAGNKKCFSL